MTAVAGQKLYCLRSRLSGRVITAAGDDYDRARSVWNGATDKHPAVIARCAGPGDAAAAGFAQQAGLEISVRGGAHNFGGAAVGDGSLPVDLSAMRQVWVDPQAPARGQPTPSRSARHCPPVTCRDTAGTPGPGNAASAARTYQFRRIRVFVSGVVVMAKYLLLFSFTGETVRRFVARPSDRAAVVRGLAESVGGGLESYYWMFGQYDGVAVIELPDSRTMAAVSVAAASSGAFTHLETHELIEAGDLAGIAERARQIAYQPPGA